MICKPDSAFEDEEEVCADVGMLFRFKFGYPDDIQGVSQEQKC